TISIEFSKSRSSWMIVGLIGSINQVPSTMNLYWYLPGGKFTRAIHSSPTFAKTYWDWFQLLNEPATATTRASGKPVNLKVTLPAKLGGGSINRRTTIVGPQPRNVKLSTLPVVSKLKVILVLEDLESAYSTFDTGRSRRLVVCDGCNHNSPSLKVTSKMKFSITPGFTP